MIRLLSHAEQLAAYLRDELLRRRWQVEMPGVAKLEAELGVNHTTVSQALVLLEDQGFLVSKGDRRRRHIVLPDRLASPAMRIALLLFEPACKEENHINEIFHGLADQGHTAFFADKTLVELRMDVRRVERLVKQTKADAWIVRSASREVLEWFAGKGLRTFALFGRWEDLPVAGIRPDYRSALLALTRRLIAHGHRRIVFLGKGPFSRMFRRSFRVGLLHAAGGAHPLGQEPDRAQHRPLGEHRGPGQERPPQDLHRG